MYRFSLKSLFETCTAIAIVLVGYGSGLPDEDGPTFAEFVGYYVIKLVLALGCRRQRSVAVVLNGVILLVISGQAAHRVGFSFNQPTEFGFVMFVWFFQWYVLPSLTFFYDAFATRKPSFRFVLWRSVLEVVVGCPIAYYVASIILAAVFGQLGIFPF